MSSFCGQRRPEFLFAGRCYLFFFERILQKAAGSDSLSLPYWAWEQDPKKGLLAAFLEEKVVINGQMQPNPLYNSARDPNFAGGGGLSGLDRIRTGLRSALGRAEFYSSDISVNYGFNISLESSPHNRIHNLVGGANGDMSDPAQAAGDPIFWVHHANVDRMWNVWLKADPLLHKTLNDRDFLLQHFHFADAGGCEVRVTISDIIDATKHIIYAEEEVTKEVQQAAKPFKDTRAEPLREQRAELVVVASSSDGETARSAFAPAAKPLGFATETATLKPAAGLPLAAGAPASTGARGGGAELFSRALPAAPARYVIEVNGIQYTKPPSFVFDVVVSAPGEDPTEQGEFLGSINFFSSPRGSRFTESFAATEAIEALRAAGRLGEGEIPIVSLVPSTLLPVAGPGMEERADKISAAAYASVGAAQMTYESIKLLQEVNVP